MSEKQEEQSRDKTKRKDKSGYSRKGVMILSLTIIIFALVVVFMSVSRRSISGQDTDFSTETDETGTSSHGEGENGVSEHEEEEMPFLCRFTLSADRTQFHIGEEASVTFTLSVPEETEGRVVVADETGEIVFETDASGMEKDGKGRRTADFALKQDTSIDQIRQYQASGGDYYSSPLKIYITPVITEDMIGEAVQIALEAHDVIDEKYTDRTPAEKAEAAKDFLEKDKRVAAAQLMEDGENVLFVTKNSVGAVYQTEPDDEEYMKIYADDGINEGSSKPLEEGTLLTELFEETGTERTIDKNNVLLFMETSGSLVSSDPDVLLLIPCPEEMDEEPSENIRSEAQKLANKLWGQGEKTLEGDDAVYAILRQELNEYGTITLFTHGAKWGTSEKVTSYLLWRREFEKETKDQTVKYFTDKVRTYAYAAYFEDKEGKEDFADFYSSFYASYDKEKGKYNSLPRIYSVVSGSECKIRMTGDYIIDRYQDQYFDNAVFYIASCYGLQYRALNEFLVSHGCSYVLGFMDSVAQNNIAFYAESLADYLSSYPDGHPDYTGEMLESFGEISGLDSRNHHYIKHYSWIQALYELLVRSGETGDPVNWDEAGDLFLQFGEEKLRSIYGENYISHMDELGKLDLHNKGDDILETEELLGNQLEKYINNIVESQPVEFQITVENLKGRLSRGYLNDNRDRSLRDLLDEAAQVNSLQDAPVIQNLLDDPALDISLLNALISSFRELRDSSERWITQTHEKNGWKDLYISSPTAFGSYDADLVPEGFEDNTLYYYTDDNPVFAYRGKGTFTGSVVLAEEDENGNPSEETIPADGALVIAYLVRNHQFTECGRTLTNENGEFVFENLPMGHLVMTAQFNSDNSEPYSTYFVEGSQETWQGGEITIIRRFEEEPVFSDPIGEYLGTEYVIPIPDEWDPLEGLETLPVDCPIDDYRITSFAFYGGKLYFWCGGIRSDSVSNALFECNPDGTGIKELARGDKAHGDCPKDVFIIKDGTLYYDTLDGNNVTAIDLRTGNRHAVIRNSQEKSELEEGSEELAICNLLLFYGEYFYQYKNGYFYRLADDVSTTYPTHQGITGIDRCKCDMYSWYDVLCSWDGADNEWEMIIDNKSEKGVMWLAAVTEDYLYCIINDFSSDAEVVRVDLSSPGFEERTVIGSIPNDADRFFR